MKAPDESRSRAIRLLTEQLGSEKVVSSGRDYDATRNVWNAAVVSHPAAVVLCEATSDVQAAVKIASTHGVTLSVRGGGHDERCVRGDLVLDLTRMRDVTIDGQVAIVQGGATITDVAEAVSARGMVAVTGVIGAVGMAGLATGGGYGQLTAKFGMASDNILGAEVILADGRLVQMDEIHEPDLFWAIRGGGGNFGVITRLRLRLHPMRNISEGVVTFPWEQASTVFASYNRLIETSPEGLTLSPGFAADQDGVLRIHLRYAWCGPDRDDKKMIEQVKSLGTPVAAEISRKTLAQILKEAEARYKLGIHWSTRQFTVSNVHPELVKILSKAMEERSSPLSYIGAHPFYGPGEHIPVESTAFGIRCRHIMFGIFTAWKPGDDATHQAWADRVEAAVQPYALPSNYPNYFGIGRPEQVARAYGPNAPRLLEIKKTYDPGNLFSAISLPPA